jgi:hypothetical protein
MSPSAAAAWIAQKPPMLEPRMASRGVCSRIRPHIVSTSSKASGPNRPSECPWPRASKASAAMSYATAALPKSKWLSFADPEPWQITTPARGSTGGRNSA